jgi:hypothetical protein
LEGGCCGVAVAGAREFGRWVLWCCRCCKPVASVWTMANAGNGCGGKGSIDQHSPGPTRAPVHRHKAQGSAFHQRLRRALEARSASSSAVQQPAWEAGGFLLLYSLFELRGAFYFASNLQTPASPLTTPTPVPTMSPPTTQEPGGGGTCRRATRAISAQHATCSNRLP